MNMYQTDSVEHRLWSSSATFQKGLYHLFLLKRRADADAYARVLRTYQALFLLVETGYLLDFERKIPKPESRHMAPDPAGNLGHKDLRNWDGFPCEHSLAIVSRRSIALLKRVWEARNNLIYRPHMRLQDSGRVKGFFEDCTLQDLLSGEPTASEVESLYAQFLEAIGQWNTKGDGRAGDFLTLLHSRYHDRLDRFPAVTLLRRYALILGGTQDMAPEFENYENEWMERVILGFRTQA